MRLKIPSDQQLTRLMFWLVIAFVALLVIEAGGTLSDDLR
jgi:hypothetical protein